MLRGVSGGERKRVTTGEMSFGNKYVTMMDGAGQCGDVRHHHDAAQSGQEVP
ncbi:hypothetical protein PI125_g25320 [Phytophthora idaei]|nr:hypothetical protein PI125_g25320 [Phytophthora idaei]KAG3124404.1 hypothetical protein PI126_g23265 [Phytophthora idaei]